MNDNLLDELDLTPDEPEVKPAESETNTETLGEVLRRLDILAQDVATARQAPEPTAPTQQEQEEQLLFDPAKFLEANASQTQQLIMAGRKAEQDIRKQFGGKLTEDDVNEIITELSSLPPRQLIDVVKRNGHLAMGYARYGMAVDTGKVKPGEKRKQVTTNVGTESPPDSSETNANIAEFEKHYGKMTKREKASFLAVSGGR